MNLAFDRDLLPYEAILARYTDSALASPFRKRQTDPRLKITS